ncbi:MAG: tRNA (adenosine(37)-N6)-threonylcarbamoyltransferase complex dimerization subunit type 1 TsaB [Cyanobacteria bacterium CRU_2_1]|nr:tRNA (adenosine(37)-N6)-threonylcarbamoyltransferase complex dimerization subunit type 1 TsaB [Cyanobacteria bacterium RU_5_0]NJR61646.1 tRNA (adenosine(37)-N6)-threonylcarbamoyltransferase complex dimerization subunit type 1 TsaB [Cyanobacteria bacterium CRU_2_1]
MSNIAVLSYALAIHTASPDLGLALSNFAGDDRSQIWAGLGRDSSNYLHSHLAEFIQPQTWINLAFIAVAKGPGGFTGTRLGVVTARTLAQQLTIPLFAISTLAAVAWGARSSILPSAVLQANPPDIAVQMPAHRGELYTAIYSIRVLPDLKSDWSDGSTLVTRLPDSVMAIEQWQKTLDSWEDPYHLIQVEGGLGETALNLLELAYKDWQQGQRPIWSDALPFYGQSPV